MEKTLSDSQKMALWEQISVIPAIQAEHRFSVQCVA